MQEMQENPQKLYEDYLRLIRYGNTWYEPYARQLAEEYGFPLQKLKEALIIGSQKEFEDYLRLIRDGNTWYEPDAKRLAEEYGFPLQKLKEALIIGSQKEFDGRQKEFEEYLRLIRYGNTWYEPYARQLAEEYGFPLQELEEALITGREKLKRLEEALITGREKLKSSVL